MTLLPAYKDLLFFQQKQRAALIRRALMLENWCLQRAALRLQMHPGTLYNTLLRATSTPLQDLWQEYRNTQPTRGRTKRLG